MCFKGTRMIAEALKRMRGRMTIDDLATRTGVHKNTIGNYERGERLPEIDFLVAFAKVTGADLWELVLMRVQAAANPQATALEPDVRKLLGAPMVALEAKSSVVALSDEFELIPRYNVTASMGAGSLPGEVEEVGRMAFRRDWLRREGLATRNLVAITLAGDSMVPTIRDGALALVDTSENQVNTDGVYVLRLDGHLIAKRLQPDFAGGVYIRSDNPAYREQHLSADVAATLTVVGRAIWAGSKL